MENKKIILALALLLLAAGLVGCVSDSSSSLYPQTNQQTNIFQATEAPAEPKEIVVELGFDLKELGRKEMDTGNYNSPVDVLLVQDTETGVQYFLYIDNVGDEGGAAMCPRYNADGTLYVSDTN